VPDMDLQPRDGHGRNAVRTLQERRNAGVAQRRNTPRSALAEWTLPTGRADPVTVLIEQGTRRIPELLPVRYTRMQADPFAFLRGAAAIMAGLRRRSFG
jgi:Uncharacterized protein conserved in bacteria (DUF2252)